MISRFDTLKKELDKLVAEGQLLYYSMAKDLDKLSEESVEEMKKQKIKFVDFSTDYDTWYTESLRVINQIIPDRLEDFIKQYKDVKRKSVDFLTYCISDYLIGLETTRGYDTVANGTAALPKMRNQLTILASARKRFKSKLFDIKDIIQADLFDSELQASKELCKQGFVRGAGAISGVVLEKHLAHVCSLHKIKSRKKYPSISDFNQLLKDNEIIETSQWRFIQHLTDIRNLCDHKKEKEPTKEDVEDLNKGVEKVIKTIF